MTIGFPPAKPSRALGLPESKVRWRMTPMRWLFIAIAAFVVVSFVLSWLRSYELETTTWDMGVYQQAIWTSAHGRPFYETADVETGGYGSLLQVHSVLLFYLLVPVYAALPSQSTLFAVQSVAVGLAAVPLYLLARDLSSSPRIGLVTGLVYLAWTPVLSSTLYDFHPEAFLPVELFTLVLFWERGRFRWGFLVAAMAFATMELAPVLTFFVAVFGLLESRLPRQTARGEPRSIRWFGVQSRRFVAWLSLPRVRASLGLLVASAAAYGLLLYLRVDVLPALLGTYPLPAPATGYVIGATPSGLQLSWANLSVGLEQKLGYWLVVVALLGFVPLLAPRAMVLSVPWFAFTLFSADLNYVTLGFQYGFVAACSLMVAFAYGTPTALRIAARISPLVRRRRAARGADSPRFPKWSEIRRGRRALLVAGLTVFLGANLALSPLNPMMDGQVQYGTAYRISYFPNPNDAQVGQLASLIPPGASVLATDNLFPLVANDAQAYTFAPGPDPGLPLPFSPAHPPTYVLLAQDTRYDVVPWLPQLLTNSSIYGVRGVVWSSDPGVVLLYEKGYLGAPVEFGTPPTPAGTYYGSDLVYPGAGSVATDSNATFSSVVVSSPGTIGTAWFGPGISLAPGEVSARLSVRVTLLPGASPPTANTSVLSVLAEAWGITFCNLTLPYQAFQTSTWTTVELNASIPEPTIEFGIAGVVLNRSIQVTLNYLSLGPGAPDGGGNGTG